jgi:hypothetical protein
MAANLERLSRQREQHPMRLFRASFVIVGTLVVGLSSPVAQEPLRSCPASPDGPRHTYRSERSGFAMSYPPMFVLDPDSIPETGESAQFSTADGRATAIVIGSANRNGHSLEALRENAEQDLLQNSGGEITYRRSRDNWFVISGYMVGRIFYQRTMLMRQGRTATLWIEFPRDMRPCFDEAVTMMSLSFREN